MEARTRARRYRVNQEQITLPVTNIDVKNLCSRKLLELVATGTVDPRELWAVVDELQQRRHYLTELEQALPGSAWH